MLIGEEDCVGFCEGLCMMCQVGEEEMGLM